MAIIVETGLPVANANSYISVLDADAYHAARGHEDWADLDTGEKEIALVKAMDYMLQAYRLRWKGARSYIQQTLDWPRTGVCLFDRSSYGYTIGHQEMPVELGYAQAELALRAATADLNPDIEPRVTREQVGPIVVDYEPHSPQQTAFRAIDMLLAPYMNGGNASVLLVRS